MKIENDKAAVDVRYRPKLNWFADAGLNTSPVDVFNHFGLSAGVNFTIPIYDGRQRQLEYQKLTLSQNTRANYESFFKTQYKQQVQQLSNELAVTQETLVQLEKQQSTAQELIDMAKSELDAGNMPITEFINAVKNYVGINRDINQARIKTFGMIIEINYLMQQ
jgi:outer membrane protein TolC